MKSDETLVLPLIVMKIFERMDSVDIKMTGNHKCIRSSKIMD
jgi:hypothetical protein